MLFLENRKTRAGAALFAPLAVAAMLLHPGQSLACNIFVATTGSDTNTGLTTNDPLRTIQAAADIALTPGDIVCVRPGVYFENNQSAPATSVKGVKPQASGAVGNPIVFQADPNFVGLVVIDQQHDQSRAPGATVDPVEAVGFFIQGEDHITIRGFEIRNVTTGILTDAIDQPFSSGVGAQGLFDPPSNIVIENNHIYNVRKDQRLPNFDGNIGPVVVNNCQDCAVRNNRLHDVSIINGSGVEVFTNANNAGVFSFGMLRTVVENNEIYNAHTGIFVKAWSEQPEPTDADYNPATLPPAINTATDFGVLARRNLIYDVVWGVHLSPSGGSGRIISNSGEANGNPGHHNAEIRENVFFSTAAAPSRLGSEYARMEWALTTDLRGTADQSNGLKFINNTVITHNGVNVDAVTNTEIYNNFFSLSAVTSGIAGPHIAVQASYSRLRAEQLLDGGTQLNLGTPAAPVAVVPTQGVGVSAAAGTNRAAAVCVDNGVTPDPDLTDNGGNFPASTQPNLPTSPAGDVTFFCDDNVQWSAEIALADFNYYHIEPDPADPNAPEDNSTFRLQRFGAGGNGVQIGGIEQLVNFANWQTFQAFNPATGAGDFGMAVSNPDANSMPVDLTSQANILSGVTIVPSAGVVLDPTSTTPFLHTAILDNLGDADGIAGGATVHVGAFPSGAYNPAGGPFNPATDSGFIGTPRLVGAPGGVAAN